MKKCFPAYPTFVRVVYFVFSGCVGSVVASGHVAVVVVDDAGTVAGRSRFVGASHVVGHVVGVGVGRSGFIGADVLVIFTNVFLVRMMASGVGVEC